nr:hypothetical protein [Tanacetum cinerariifolium]
MESLRESISKRAKHKRENDRMVNDKMMQLKEGKVASSKALDVGSIVTECNGTKSDKQDISSRSRNDTHAEDVDIKPVNDKELMFEVDRNSTPASTNMYQMGGEIDQNAKKCQVSCPLLDPSSDNMTTDFSNQSLMSENISLKRTVAHLQNDFSRMEAHCVNMELKYQNQALKDGKHGQILNETSNKAKIKKEIEDRASLIRVSVFGLKPFILLFSIRFLYGFVEIAFSRVSIPVAGDPGLGFFRSNGSMMESDVVGLFWKSYYMFSCDGDEP